jgi:hypothetical protein
MMVLPSKKLVERLQKRVKNGFFVDTATITYKTASTYDSYGQVTYSESDVEVDCSFTDKVSKETWAEYADIESIEAEIRFAGTKPSKGDSVTLTHRFNRSDTDSQNYTSAEYEIVGVKDRDVFGYVCALKKVAV